MTFINAIMKGNRVKRVELLYQYLVNLVCPIILLVVSYQHLFKHFLDHRPVAAVSIVTVDVYVAFLMVLSAFKHIQPIPDRHIALAAIPLLMLTLVISFAKLYIDNKHVWRLGIEDNNNHERLADPWDAVYYSATTITTLGYGDYSPQDWSSRKLVRRELLSGGLLLFLAFPVLGSRLAMFDDASGTIIRRLKDGQWEVKHGESWPIKYPPGKRLTVTLEAEGVTSAHSED